MQTLVDTTSLMAIFQFEKDVEEYKKHCKEPYIRDSSDLRYACANLNPGIEALVLYDEVLVDAASFFRNMKRYPGLSSIERLATFIHKSNSEESECYQCAATVLAPLLTQPGAWLVDALRRHIMPLDTCELSVANQDFYPSTYWTDLAPVMGGAEKQLVMALERVLGESTPFSGAALAQLVRLFYYFVAQEMHQCSIFLHPLKGELLQDIPESEFGVQQNPNQISKTILDAFDSDLQANFREQQQKWFGGTELVFTPPSLFEYVYRKSDGGHKLLEAVLEVRGSQEARDYRAGMNALAAALNEGYRQKAAMILADLEAKTKSWELQEDADGRGRRGIMSSGIGRLRNKGLQASPVRNQESSADLARGIFSKIRIDVPLIRALGTKISSLVPKRTQSPSERIFTFLHLISSPDYA